MPFSTVRAGIPWFRKIETEDVINKRLMTSVFDPELLGAEIKRKLPLIQLYVNMCWRGHRIKRSF